VEIFAVYYNPTDYPGLFVVRRQVAGRGTVMADPNPLAVAPTLEGARLCIPPGVERFDRHPDDDQVIVETWM